MAQGPSLLTMSVHVTMGTGRSHARLQDHNRRCLDILEPYLKNDKRANEAEAAVKAAAEALAQAEADAKAKAEAGAQAEQTKKGFNIVSVSRLRRRTCPGARSVASIGAHAPVSVPVGCKSPESGA